MKSWTHSCFVSSWSWECLWACHLSCPDHRCCCLQGHSLLSSGLTLKQCFQFFLRSGSNQNLVFKNSLLITDCPLHCGKCSGQARKDNISRYLVKIKWSYTMTHLQVSVFYVLCFESVSGVVSHAPVPRLALSVSWTWTVDSSGSDARSVTETVCTEPHSRHSR